MADTNLKGNTLFVTGTDTEVGKTFICGLLLRYLIENQVDAVYQKWVSTGGKATAEDLSHVLKWAGLVPEPELLMLQVPFRFELPASPHLAAEQENSSVEPEAILHTSSELARQHELLLIEGVGGLLVPLRRDLLLGDLLARLQLQTLVVARSGLGTLNHTLLTIEALRARNIPIFGVVLSDTTNKENEIIVRDNLRTIEEIGKVKVFGRLPWCGSPEEAQLAFQPLGERIQSNLFSVLFNNKTI